MKLYVIRDAYDGIRIFDIEVDKVTPRGFKIDDYRVVRCFLNKSDLYVRLSIYMFGLDKDTLIEKWNEHIDSKISDCEKQIEKLKDMIIQ